MNKRINLVLIFLVIILLITGQPLMADEGQEELFLDDIVVTASKYSEKISDTAVSMEVLTQEDIQEKSSQNVAELLRDLTGIYISDYGGLAGQKLISIRGSESNQVLVLMDGQVINSSQNGQIDLSQLPVEQIERIEVLKGPASALYGANALGGVVNIITKGGSRKPITEFKVTYGSFETQQTAFSHSGNTGRIGYNVTAVEKDSDGDRENSSLEQMMFFSKFDIEMDQYNDLILSFQYNDSDKGVPGSKTYITPNAKQEDKDTGINLKWEQSRESYDTNLMVYYNKHEQVYDEGYTEASIHDTARTALEFNRTDYFKSHNLTYGLEYKRNEIDSNENGQHNKFNQALFVQDKWQVIELLELSIGTRFDDHEDYGSELSPRFGAVYSINDKTNIFVSAAKAYRSPTFNELYWPYQDYGMYGVYIGNPDLEPETALAYETGIRYFKQDIKMELNYFTRDVEDLIDWVKEGNTNMPHNIDEAKTRGAELILSKKFDLGITVSFNYTYLDSWDKETDDKLAPSHNANLNLSYKKGDISSSLVCHSVKNRPDELDDYTVVDARLAKVFFFDEGESELYFKVNNLLNNKDYEVREGYPMPERNYTLGLSTKF